MNTFILYVSMILANGQVETHAAGFMPAEKCFVSAAQLNSPLVPDPSEHWFCKAAR